MKRLVHNPEEMAALAKDFVAGLPGGETATVVALTGDLGAGKTNFAGAVARVLGVQTAVQSPTFLIERVYELEGRPWQHLVHIDAYRLDDPKELLQLGWEETVSNKGNLVLVEWADKVKNILPKSAIHIVFNHVSETVREVDIQSS